MPNAMLNSATHNPQHSDTASSHTKGKRTSETSRNRKNIGFDLSHKDTTSWAHQYPFPMYITKDRFKRMVRTSHKTAVTRTNPIVEYEVDWAVDEDKVVCMVVHVEWSIRHWMECLEGRGKDI